MARRPSPQVTVIVPCFNAAPWLRHCLGSIFNQSLRAAEVIFVDDGSTDESPDIAAEYPVRLLRMGTNRGASAARNVGLRAAAHERIAWLDADDLWDRARQSLRYLDPQRRQRGDVRVWRQHRIGFELR